MPALPTIPALTAPVFAMLTTATVLTAVPPLTLVQPLPTPIQQRRLTVILKAPLVPLSQSPAKIAKPVLPITPISIVIQVTTKRVVSASLIVSKALTPPMHAVILVTAAGAMATKYIVNIPV